MNRITLYQTPEHDCPYLSNQKAVTQFVDPAKIPNSTMYTHLNRNGFRRSGDHLYRPACPNCKACVATRLPVQEMEFSNNQKRTLKRALQFEYLHLTAFDSDEHYAVYEKYINIRHKGGDMYPPTRELFRRFLLSSWSDTQFLEIRYNTSLIACAVYDRLIDGISAVYCYFDPDFSQFSPGKLAILKQIQFSKESNLKYLYLGFQINNCSKMNYKTKFHPVEQFLKMNWERID